jgi:hypothetical protein
VTSSGEVVHEDHPDHPFHDHEKHAAIKVAKKNREDEKRFAKLQLQNEARVAALIAAQSRARPEAADVKTNLEHGKGDSAVSDGDSSSRGNEDLSKTIPGAHPAKTEDDVRTKRPKRNKRREGSEEHPGEDAVKPFANQEGETRSHEAHGHAQHKHRHHAKMKALKQDEAALLDELKKLGVTDPETAGSVDDVHAKKRTKRRRKKRPPKIRIKEEQNIKVDEIPET